MSSTHSHLQTYLRCLMHTDTELPPRLTPISVNFTAQAKRACCHGLISIPGSHSHALIPIPGSRSHASTSIPGYIVSGLLRGYISPPLTHQSKSNRCHLLSAEAVFQRADGKREHMFRDICFSFLPIQLLSCYQDNFSEDNEKTFLVENQKGSLVEYAALSHRWSEATKSMSLSKSNHARILKDGITLHRSGRTLKDVIEVLVWLYDSLL